MVKLAYRLFIFLWTEALTDIIMHDHFFFDGVFDKIKIDLNLGDLGHPSGDLILRLLLLDGNFIFLKIQLLFQHPFINPLTVKLLLSKILQQFPIVSRVRIGIDEHIVGHLFLSHNVIEGHAYRV